MQHNDSYQENTYGFVNNITTPEGGTHIVWVGVFYRRKPLMNMQEQINC